MSAVTASLPTTLPSVDAIVVEIRDGQVVNRPTHAVIGIAVKGERAVARSGE